MGVENPATEATIAEIALGTEADASRAILAAREAFEALTSTSVEARLALLARVLALFRARAEDFATAMQLEMRSFAYRMKAAFDGEAAQAGTRECEVKSLSDCVLAGSDMQKPPAS